MKDNETIKALECCSEKNCKNCPCLDENIECGEKTIKLALDLINRQQAEIERLGKELIKQQLKNNMLYETAKEAKAEAVKEFAERLKNEAFLPIGTSIAEHIITANTIDDLVKEMTEQSVNYGSSKTEGNG